MIAGEIPAYYIFMYGSFSDGKYKYMILEAADCTLDDLMIEHNLTIKEYFRIFYHIASAISYLEDLQFNHGDLWSENIVVSFPDKDIDGPDSFVIKLIDYDCAFKSKSSINHPSIGGADDFRDKFILGYDLNRFFDALLFSYKAFVKKRRTNQVRKWKRKHGKKVKPPKYIETDSSDEEYDEANIIFPPEIIDFMNTLNLHDPSDFRTNPEMSGKSIMKKILEYAKNLDMNIWEEFDDESDDESGSEASSESEG